MKALDFKDVLIVPKKTKIFSRKNVNIKKTFNFKYSSVIWNGVPIISSNMTSVSTPKLYEVLKNYDMLTCMPKYLNNDVEENILNKYKKTNDDDKIKNIIFSIGLKESDLKIYNHISNYVDSDWICLDIANGYIEDFVKYCAFIREQYPNKIIIAGNVATPEGVEELIVNGKVDIVKVGIGSGAACLTRLKTGVGIPQLHAVIECSKKAHELGGHIISDGGITSPADLCKAFGAGADFVMCGSVFGGHYENINHVIEKEGKQYTEIYGMSSEYAMDNFNGGKNKYRTSEGRHCLVQIKGNLSDTIDDYLGGLRSYMTYINANNIDECNEKTEFIEVNSHSQLNRSLE